MPTTIYSASLHTQRISNKTKAQSFFTRMNNSQPTYGPMLGDSASSEVADVILGKVREYRKNQGCGISNLGCPCAVQQLEQAQQNVICTNDIQLIPQQVASIALITDLDDNSEGCSMLNITNDINGNIYACGVYISNSPITLKNLDGSNSSYTLPTSLTILGGSGFMVKYNTSGQVSLVIRLLNNSTENDTYFQSIIVKDNGNIYIGGKYSSITAITLATGIVLPATANTITNAMLICYNSSGTVLWAKTVPSTGTSQIDDITLNNNNIIALGSYIDSSGNINIGNSKQLLATSGTEPAGFIINYSSIDGTINWPISLGNATSYTSLNYGTLKITPEAIISDVSNNFYICGDYQLTTSTFTPNAIRINQANNNQTSSYLSSTGTALTSPSVPSASQNGFIIKYDTSGNFQWRILSGAISTSTNEAYQLVINSNMLYLNNILYVIGGYNSPNSVILPLINATDVSGTKTLPASRSNTFNQLNSFIIEITPDGSTINNVAIFNTNNSRSTTTSDTTIYGILNTDITNDLSNNIFISGGYRVYPLPGISGENPVITIPNINGSPSNIQLPNSQIYMLGLSGESMITNAFIIKYDPSGNVSNYLRTATGNTDPPKIINNGLYSMGSINTALCVNQTNERSLYATGLYYSRSSFGARFRSNTQLYESPTFPSLTNSGTAASLLKLC